MTTPTIPSYVSTPLDDITAVRNELGKAFRTGKSKDVAFRKTQLLALAHLIQENVPAIQEALRRDLGRPPLETKLLEVSGALSEIKLALANVSKWSKAERTPFSFNYAAMRPTVRKEPKGVTLIIVPFNYPVTLSMLPLVGAIAAGCAAVLKPSELTPAYSALLADLFPRYLDPTLYRVINGAVPETSKLLELQWDHILFTGSARVARIVLAAAAKTLSPVTTELGGKSPVIVDPSCDLKIAAKRIIWGKTANAGQTCVAPDYILVPRTFQDKFIQACTDILKEFFPEGARKSDSYSRIISEPYFDRVAGLIKGTKGTIVYGGGVDRESKFVEPTIVKDVGLDDCLMAEELFGPVLPIVPVDSIDEAIEIVNARDHPLALYVFAQDSGVKRKVLDNTQSGSAIINECLLQVTADHLPFGGIGPSGSGQYTGKWSFDTFTHFRSTMDNPSWVDMLVSGRYPPFSDKSTRFAFKMLIPSFPARNSKSNRWAPSWVLLPLAAATAAAAVFYKKSLN